MKTAGHPNRRQFTHPLIACCLGAVSLSAQACDPTALHAFFDGPAEFDLLLEQARVRMNGKEAPSTDIPELQENTAGSATLRIGPEGHLDLAHSDGYLSGSAELIDATPWEWETASPLAEMRMSAQDAEASLGCSGGALPRWRVAYPDDMGVERTLELVLVDQSTFAGYLVAITRGENVTFEVERGLGLFRR